VVKRVLPAHGTSRRFRSMFVEEAQLATRLNHPNIVQVYEFSDHGDEGLLLSMEHVDGPDLGKVMSAAKQKGARIAPTVAAYIVSEAARGLHYAHERKDEGGAPLAIVHRDVSPQNVLLSFEGTVKIADFGIASANLFREEPGVLKGKFGYMSPEQARGERVDRRSDVYALGVVLYELLTLRSPYGRLADDALLEAVKRSEIEPPSAFVTGIPPDIEAIVMRALSKDVTTRFQTARDMGGAIARALLARQELVDHTSVEALVHHVFGRDARSPSPPQAEGAETMAAVPLARLSEGEATGQRRAQRAVHEVRHVAVVSLRIVAEAGGDDAAAKQSALLIRGVLDDIAYKHGAVFSWLGDWEARAIVGLLANPSRAAHNAAMLAVDVHEALKGASEDLSASLLGAIGILRGIASGERNASGHLVNHTLQEPANYLAARIGEHTPPGKTWVAGGVFRLVRRDFRWGDGPTIELVDAENHRIPTQLRLYSLERPLTREERLAELALAPSDLVGRDAEKADLFAAFHRATSATRGSERSLPPPSLLPGPPSGGSASPATPRGGRGEIVTRAVLGEMGIGKTALVAAFLSELPEETRVVRVECSPVKSELPLATIGDLLREAAGIAQDHAPDAAVAIFEELMGATGRGPHASRLARSLAELATGRAREGAADEDAAHYRRDLVVVGVRHLLGSMALAGPLVLVVDGLQWADTPSLELIREFLKRSERVPILLLLVTRPEERLATYLEGIVRIELGGLTADEQIRLVEARLGVREGVVAVCRELVPKVAGNPFFLLELIDALLENGTLEIVERPQGPAELVCHEPVGRSLDLPSTLEQLIGDRLRELPAEELDVLRWLAVARGPLPEADLLALARLENNEPIGRLCARGLCDTRGDEVDLRHPLARDVAYNALEPNTRARMHRLLGERLASSPLAEGLSAAIVGRHLAEGNAGAAAVGHYLAAARAARGTHQASLAHKYFHRVLKLAADDDPRRIEAHEALEGIYRHQGRRAQRRSHLLELRRLARAEARPSSVALALARTARFDFDDGHLARGLPVAKQAADLAREAQNATLEVDALTVLSEILRDLGDVRGALAACEQALEVAQTGHLPARSRAEVLRAKGVLLRRVGRIHEAVEAHAEAIAIFRAVGARRPEARARNALAFAMFVLERFEDVIALGLSSIGIDLAIGGRFQMAKTLSNIGQAYARLGDTQRGLAYLHRARDAHERYADQDSRVDTLLCTAGVLVERGDVDAAHTLVTDAGALVAAMDSPYDAIHERLARALVARAHGNARLSAELAALARRGSETHGLPSFHLYATAVEAAARVELGEVHTGLLLATTAQGGVEAIAGCEYGLEVRALCVEALRHASPDTARDGARRALLHVRKVTAMVRDARLREQLAARPVVAGIVEAARAQGLDVEGGSGSRSSA
jgi:predicted ATPase